MYKNIFITHRTEEQPASVYVWGDGRHNDAGLRVFEYSEFDYAYKLEPKGDKETIFGDRVKKTKRWKEGQDGIYESDLPRETRVLTDLYLHSDDIAQDHRIGFLDIEVDSEGGFASLERADKEITAIGFIAQQANKKFIFLLDKDERLPSTHEVDAAAIFTFKTERELLQAFMLLYKEYEPTIITGWNINNYDIPYLYRRLSVVFDETEAAMLSPIGIIKYSQRREQYQIAGVSCLDYFLMYQKFTYSRRPSYRLHDIGLYEVNMGKIEYEGTLDNLFRSDLKKFIEYNLRDNDIVEAIDKKMKLINLVTNISHVGHTQYEDYQYSSKYIEGTIVTYLHRKNKVVPDKRPEGRAEFDQKLEDDEDGFKGAFVKEPVPGLYEWVYNLDLQSLYPSIIMSLNISPETKIGFVRNWDVEKYIKQQQDEYVVEIDKVQNVLTPQQFIDFMKDEKFMISSNGVLYRSDKLGIIPEILDKWFVERAKFKDMMKQYKKEGNEELADYYDKRQHVQKILLNSIYGVLGLPIFRFYDLDNALAVTATGQDVIKTTAKFVNRQYTALHNNGSSDTTSNNEDYCIYIDTDSVYFSSLPLLDVARVSDIKRDTIDIAREQELKLNIFYNFMAKKMFFADKHRFVIKGEAVSQTAFWVAKKRYAMLKVFDLESNMDMPKEKLAIKGLDVVRSSFPPAFQKFMSDSLNAILRKATKEQLDKMVTDFRKAMNGMEFKELARNTSVKNISEHDSKRERGFQIFPKGCPAHVKSCIAYNRWLRNNNLDKIHQVIRDGDKIKWCYLKDNPLKLATMALKGSDDPPELVDYVSKYMDYQASFDNELKNKLEDFYNAMGWGMLPTDINQNAAKVL
jgi:DNA polymerase elongation subunit (family B)